MLEMSGTGVNEHVLRKLREQLSDVGLVKRLTAYCRGRTRGRSWYGQSQTSEVSLAKGQMPGDIVQLAISKTIKGAATGEGRLWDGDRDLFDYLTSVIDSELSNLRRSATNMRMVRASAQGNPDEEGESFLERVRDPQAKSGESALLAQQEEDAAEAFLEEFLDFLEREEFLVAVVGLLIDGVRPRKIAEELSVSVDEVYNARKRLRRRLRDFQSTLPREQETQ